jgi:hypothetical protein
LSLAIVFHPQKLGNVLFAKPLRTSESYWGFDLR